MKESYFSENRVNAIWRRITRNLAKTTNSNNDFTPISIINSPKHINSIVAFTLFGDGNALKFWSTLVKPLLNNAELVKKILPGWTLRVYISSSLPQKIYNALIQADYELIVFDDNPSKPFTGLLWRFLVAEEKVPFLVYDADMSLANDKMSLPGLKKVHNWLASDKKFFRRKMFPNNMFWPISAGMWGGKPTKKGFPVIPDIKQKLEKYDYDWFGCDEAFLSKEIWPLFKKEGFYNISSTSEKIFWIFVVLILIAVIVIVIRKYRQRV